MNVFPVKVLAPDGSTRFADCRMIYDGTSTTVWTWPSGAPQPQPVLRIAGPPVTDGKTHTFETGDGTVTVVESEGCGCGARLKNYTPMSARPARAFAAPGA